MRTLGLKGATRGKAWKTTFPDLSAPRPFDLVDRQFTVRASHRVWVAGQGSQESITASTCFPPRVGGGPHLRATWSGFVYAAVVADAYLRMILGRQVSASLRPIWLSMPWRWLSGDAVMTSTVSFIIQTTASLPVHPLHRASG
jgi:putative transposase